VLSQKFIVRSTKRAHTYSQTMIDRLDEFIVQHVEPILHKQQCLAPVGKPPDDRLYQLTHLT